MRNISVMSRKFKTNCHPNLFKFQVQVVHQMEEDLNNQLPFAEIRVYWMDGHLCHRSSAFRNELKWIVFTPVCDCGDCVHQ